MDRIIIVECCVAATGCQGARTTGAACDSLHDGHPPDGRYGVVQRRGERGVTYGHISGWDTSQVEDMSSLFSSSYRSHTAPLTRTSRPGTCRALPP